MKKLRVISFILVVVLVAGLFAGCKKKNTVGENELIWYTTMDVAPDTERVLKKFNDRLEELTGCRVKFVNIDNAQYDLRFSSGEEFDLIYAPDHGGYWLNAPKGAFMEITEEDFKKYAPYIWEHGKEQLDVAKYNGKYYGIPAIGESWTADRCYGVRGDLMDKYGIETLDTVEDIDKYLMAVAKGRQNGETNIIPYNINGGVGYMIFVMFAADWGWGNPGSLSYGSHYYYDLFDKDYKLFLALDKPETREFSLTAKKWYDNGVFSKSVLSNEVSSEEAFRNGKSAFAWINSPAVGNQLINDMAKVPEAKDWDIRFYSVYQKYQRAFNYMNYGTAISATSKKKDKALKVLNAILSDKELYYMLQYGEEGKHFEITDAGYSPIDVEDKDTYTPPYVSIRNTAFDFETKYDYPYAEDLVAELKNKTVEDPLVNCPIHAEAGEAEVMLTRLTEIYNEFSQARMYGAVDDVDKAMKTEKEALKAAGVDDYLKIVQKQVDAYIDGHPEAMERFEESKKNVTKYLKENPKKTNPKDPKYQTK